ncbi:Pectinesterase/pectinesterase inhibitor [Thalictrum thalictroides]|uniref:Pectinesterase n=1 Tax=Thalictrum thalictroides TaxID=46969 RepID=A0A7J6X336_THATH|nr:Pectinesterase/pectinesterase inhibitor [Thalictrum thalictroides]
MTKYLRKQSKLPISSIRALNDCKELAELNMDFLSHTMGALKSTKSSINVLQSQDMQALLSAIVTNQQTCLDGLQRYSSAWNATSDLHTPMYDGNKMYSLSLALFRNTWGMRWNGAKENYPNNDVSRKRIIHAYLKGVHVNNSVVVNPDGSRDFKTITDAINAAPNNTDISNGYHVIFVVAGVYEEYVNVDKNKMNIMMIGDGINRTVITGNRSAGDGWTTFNSATFNGSGDFTNITDALNAAPNNIDISNGYYVIFIESGVYQEYVNVVKNKMNIMMIGAVINRTVITAPTAPNGVCNSTVNPYFCRSTLPSNVSWDVYDYSQFSFRRSLAMAKTLSFAMTKYLEKQSNLPLSTIRALEDCKELADLTMDYLSNTMETLNSKKSSLSGLKSQDMQALLSAILTNQQTCLEGLESSSSAWNATSDLHTPMYDGNKMFSLSLALFKQAWAKSWDGAKEMFPKNEDISRKRIIHAYLKGVHVNSSVVVNPDGTGDFTTIMDAVNAAPSKTDISNGYYLIFIAAGVYEEYVNVIKNKMNLMMIGDGINRTVITGNRSVGDGWTTFNSATFSK